MTSAFFVITSMMSKKKQHEAWAIAIQHHAMKNWTSSPTLTKIEPEISDEKTCYCASSPLEGHRHPTSMHEQSVQASVFCHASQRCQVIRPWIYKHQQNRTPTKFVASRLDVSFLCYISVHARYALKQKLEVLLWATFVYLLVSCLGKPVFLHILMLKRMHEVGMPWSVTGMIGHEKIHTHTHYTWL
jgi:hypothetical protein